jgi:hypothetical protein
MSKLELFIIYAGIMVFGFGATVGSAQNRNVALNPQDVHQSKWTPASGYPHATSNSEYPSPTSQPPNPQYYALNAIDGKTANAIETANPSWGPQMISGLWWRVDFGKTVAVDSIVIWIRADWSTTAPKPHDSYWKQATLVFSDSSKLNITIDSTALPQAYHFTKRTTKMVTITNLVASAARWCALSEVQVWGYDSITTNILPKMVEVKKDNCSKVPYPEFFLQRSLNSSYGFQGFTLQGRELNVLNRGSSIAPGVLLIRPIP